MITIGTINASQSLCSNKGESTREWLMYNEDNKHDFLHIGLLYCELYIEASWCVRMVKYTSIESTT